MLEESRQSHLILTEEDLFNELASAQLDAVRSVECRRNLSAQHECQSLHAIKVCVLNCHDAMLSKVLHTE